LSQSPLYAEGWNTLGAIRLERRALPEAQAALERAWALTPYDPSTATNLGSVAFLQEDTTDAARWWSIALQLDPDNDYARRGLLHLRRKP